VIESRGTDPDYGRQGVTVDGVELSVAKLFGPCARPTTRGFHFPTAPRIECWERRWRPGAPESLSFSLISAVSNVPPSRLINRHSQYQAPLVRFSAMGATQASYCFLSGSGPKHPRACDMPDLPAALTVADDERTASIPMIAHHHEMLHCASVLELPSLLFPHTDCDIPQCPGHPADPHLPASNSARRRIPVSLRNPRGTTPIPPPEDAPRAFSNWESSARCCRG
jgi:hypothetical protein